MIVGNNKSFVVVVLVILNLLALILAGPLPSDSNNDNSFHYSEDNNSGFLPGGLLERWHSIKQKWQLVTDSCSTLYDSVKNDWQDIKEKAKDVGKDVDEDFEKAKSHTMELLNNAKKIYHKIIIDGEDAFDHFHAITKDVEESLGHLKERGGQVFDDVSSLFDVLKQDIDNEEKLLKSGNFSSALQGFKHNWNNVKSHWDKLGDDFNNLCDSTIRDWERVKQDTIVNINGVATDLKDIKNEISDLLRDLRNTYKSITVDGKNSIKKFQELYLLIKQRFEELKPVFGNALEAFRLLLKEFKTDAEIISSLRNSVTASELAEGTVEVVELGAIAA